VSVAATVSGSTATAARILDLSQLQRGFRHFFGNVHAPGFKAATP
jgi:hypothetical protein